MNRDKEPGDEKPRRRPAVPDLPLRPKPPGEPTIDRPSQSRIGDHLRAMYDGLMQQPVPDRFVDLIDQLDKRSEGQGRGPR